MEGFLTLKTMTVIILTYDLSVAHCSRSSVNPSYHGLLYINYNAKIESKKKLEKKYSEQRRRMREKFLETAHKG